MALLVENDGDNIGPSCENQALELKNYHPESNVVAKSSVVIDFDPGTNNSFEREDEKQEKTSCFNRHVESIEKEWLAFWQSYRVAIIRAFLTVLFVLYLAYLIYVTVLDFHRALPLIILTLVIIAYLTVKYLWRAYGNFLKKTFLNPCHVFSRKNELLVDWITIFALFLILVASFAITGVFAAIVNEPERLFSILGLLFLLVICFFGSKYPSKINWKTVFWGIYLQFIFGILILRTSPGFIVFSWIGKQVEAVLSYATAGASFVFGPELQAHQFALGVFPVIIFISAVFSLLIYFGLIQIFINGLSWLMHLTMGISGLEAFVAAANVFWGTVQVLIIPYLAIMTKSEMHTLICTGMASIAVNLMVVYISFGISAAHLLTASIMSAPAALVACKMMYPETETPLTAKNSKMGAIPMREKNCVEAFFNGAIAGTKMCAYILGSLIALISFLAFIDEVLRWFGYLAGKGDQITFTFICSYVLYPFAWMLGVTTADCFIVAELIGIKTFLNEFVGYLKLIEYMDAGRLNARSSVIAIYSLCGFANLGSIGIQIGSISALVPHRRAEVAQSSIRAFFAAWIACQMTACVAGILYDESNMYIMTIQVPSTIKPLFNLTTLAL